MSEEKACCEECTCDCGCKETGVCTCETCDCDCDCCKDKPSSEEPTEE